MSTTTTSLATLPEARWRTRDILVAAVIGVAFGVVFQAWNVIWEGISGLGPWRFLIYAMWLVPAVLAPLVVRKPGAALFAEMLAAAVSTLLGSQWGPDTLLSGFVQGAAAELVFAFTFYRLWSFPVLSIAAIASAAAALIHDWALYYAAWGADTAAIAGVLMAISAVVIVAGGSLFLERALRMAGVLEGFGRSAA